MHTSADGQDHGTHYFSTHGVCRVLSARDSKGGALGLVARLEVPFRNASIFPPNQRRGAPANLCNRTRTRPSKWSMSLPI